MNVNLIAIPKRKAKKEFEIYSNALKSGRKEDYLEELRQIYKYLSEGKKLINIYEAFKNVGLTESGLPRLAVVRADAKVAYFHKRENGSGKFSDSREDPWRRHKFDIQLDVELPNNTYPLWEVTEEVAGVMKRFIKHPILQTSVPIVPAALLPKYGLNNYHIIWEVDKWTVSKAPVDPILVKRVSKNIFVVLAIWDLSPIEQALIEGRNS